MSYRSPPPPPTNSSYGDTELSDDGWAQHSGPPKFTNYPQGNMGGQAMQPVFNQGQAGRYAPGNIQQLGQGQPGQEVPDMKAIAGSMTQDDILFMRKFRRDCFLNRSWGSLFMYNRTKQLPNTPGRYIIVGIGSLFFGVASYRNEFARSIRENRLNTPYMQALRRSLGLQPVTFGDDIVGDSSIEYGNKVADGSTNWDATELSKDLRYNERPEMRSPNQLNPDASYQPFEPENLDALKPAATYEELRARNRGYGR